MDPVSSPQNGVFEELLGGVINFNLIPSGPPGTRVSYILDLLTNGIVLLFVAVIVLAIVFSALAGIKFIRSQGESEKVDEAQNALKNVLIGVATVFIGVIGVIIITGVFAEDQSTTTVREALCVFIEPSANLQDCIDGAN